MKTKMFHDLESKGRNWHKELPSVSWALRANINRETRDTPFNLIYGANAVLPPEIYLQSGLISIEKLGILPLIFNEENQAEARELDLNLLEERRNTTLANVRKYQQSLKKYYNKSAVQRELNIGDLVLKKDIHTRDKHKFSSPCEVPFIVVDFATPGAYVLAEVDGAMLPNTWNANQLCKYYAICIHLINKDRVFLIICLTVQYIIFRSLGQRGLLAQTTKMISLEKEMTRSRSGHMLHPS
jgi:hypothetical protein